MTTDGKPFGDLYKISKTGRNRKLVHYRHQLIRLLSKEIAKILNSPLSLQKKDLERNPKIPVFPFPSDIVICK